MFCQEIMDYKRNIGQDILNASVTRKTDYTKPYWSWSSSDIRISCVNCVTCGNYITSSLEENLPEQIICYCIINDNTLRFMNFDIYLLDEQLDYILDEMEYWEDF